MAERSTIEDLRRELGILDSWQKEYPSKDRIVLAAQRLWREELLRKLDRLAKKNRV